jgi:adenylate cyclase
MAASMWGQAPRVSRATSVQLELLIQEEDRSAEISAGLVRVFAGLVLGAIAMITTAALPQSGAIASTHHLTGALIVGGFILSGVFAVTLARSRFYRRELAFAFLALDAALVGSSLHFNLESTGLPGDFAATFPVLWLAPLMLIVAVLRVRPNVQLFGLIAFAIVIVVVVAAHGSSDPASRQLIAGQIARFFAPQPNLMRFVMLLVGGALLVLAAHRGRSLLVRALGEAERRAALTKFLPAEIASLAIDEIDNDLRRGRRQRAAVMFVDMRDSTALAENMDPVRLSVFITAFRQRVMRATEQHGGVIDKFIGDGALVVFGLPEPRADDAARALACARTLLKLIERWNQKREFDPAVRIGIGVHVGEVFFGLVGDERRMELTVLGDVVNVAARLEQATKQSATPLLASAEAIETAGEAAAWTEIHREPLRGRAGITRVMRPA